MTVDDTATLHVLDPSQVIEYANSFVVSDTAFSLPARAQTTSITECTVPQDFRVIMLIGHMHEMGVHYRLEQLDGAGGVASTLYDTDWQPSYVSHPPVSHYDPGTPLTFAANTKLRQTCVWQNTTDQTAAFPTEMCVAFTYYIPDSGFIVCNTHAPGAVDTTDAGSGTLDGDGASN